MPKDLPQKEKELHTKSPLKQKSDRTTNGYAVKKKTSSYKRKTIKGKTI